MQFDHFVHLVGDLDAALPAYGGLGFTIQPGGHPGLGTRNAAWRIDARYIELITVHDAGVARAAFGPASPAIEPPCDPEVAGCRSPCWSPTLRATVTELRSRSFNLTDAQASSVLRSDGSTKTRTLAFLPEGPP